MSNHSGDSPDLPASGYKRVGFIGAGRLGSSLAIALHETGYEVTALSTRRSEHQDWLRRRLPEASVGSDAQSVVDAADLVFVTVSDAEIGSVADLIDWREGQSVVHCSGAVPVDVLKPARAAGAVIGGMHPLQTFPTPESSGQFAGITFGIEAQDETQNIWLVTASERLGGRAYRLSASERSAYHASAVMACGLLASLAGLAAEVWASASDLSRAEALSALTPLVKSTANSVGENGLPNALTGPYVRGDVETIRKHLDVTSSVSNEIGTAYSSVALAALHIASEQGALIPELEKRIKHLVGIALLENCEKIEEA